MTARRGWLAGGLVAAMVASFFAGMNVTPTRTTEHTQVLRTERRILVESHAESAEARESRARITGATTTRIVYRTSPAPGCVGQATERIEERTVAHSERRRDTEATTAQASSRRAATTQLEATESVRTVERAPRWSVGAEGVLFFRDTVASVRGNFAIRAMGPFWITAALDPRSASAGVRLEF